jgi:hypothetical protein
MGPLYTVRHSVADARNNLQLINDTYSQLESDFGAMAKVRLRKEQLDGYVSLVFPEPKRKDEREVAKVARDRRRAAELFTAGIGNQMPGVEGTLWAAYNGIVEMVDHGRNRRTESQHLEYIWFGGGAGIKARAFDHAKTMITELRA